MLMPLKYGMEWSGFLLRSEGSSYCVFASYACFSIAAWKQCDVVKLIIKGVD